jgi:hypothetical protein
VTSACWNVSGLVLSLIGVVLLFRFGMPYRVSQLNEGSTFSDPPTQKDLMLNRRHRLWGWVGLVLVFAGTAAQIVATLRG